MRRFLTVLINEDDESNWNLLTVGAALAQRVDADLRLVYSYQSTVIAPSGLTPETFPIAILQQTNDAMEWEARHRLENWTNWLSDRGIETQTRLLIGEATTAVRADTDQHTPWLLVVGIESSYSKFLPTEFSTELSLMSSSKVPVLAVPKHLQSVNFRDPHILVADDLRIESNELIKGAAQFLEALGGGTFIDLHAESIPRFKNSPSISKRRALTRRYLEQHTKGIAGRWLSGKTSYRAMVLSGDTLAALREASSRTKADVIALGHHRRLHRLAPHWGRISPKKMATLAKPLLIA